MLWLCALYKIKIIIILLLLYILLVITSRQVQRAGVPRLMYLTLAQTEKSNVRTVHINPMVDDISLPPQIHSQKESKTPGLLGVQYIDSVDY